jgi:hypothetical protein
VRSDWNRAGERRLRLRRRGTLGLFPRRTLAAVGDPLVLEQKHPRSIGLELAWNNSGPLNVNHINKPKRDRQAPGRDGVTTYPRGPHDHPDSDPAWQRPDRPPAARTLRAHAPRWNLPRLSTCRSTAIGGAAGRGRGRSGDVGNTRAARARRMKGRRSPAASRGRRYSTSWPRAVVVELGVLPKSRRACGGLVTRPRAQRARSTPVAGHGAMSILADGSYEPSRSIGAISCKRSGLSEGGFPEQFAGLTSLL